MSGVTDFTACMLTSLVAAGAVTGITCSNYGDQGDESKHAHDRGRRRVVLPHLRLPDGR
jgi:hypothetical protein